MITGLMTIRLATHHLSQEEFGLWNFTMQTVGYFMMLELGMSGSGTRLLGEPLARGDQAKMDSWFTLSVIALSAQALVILLLGLFSRPLIFSWFQIPAHLLDKATSLWVVFLAIQAVGLVFKLSFAILYAQNRVYWTHILQTAGLWITLLTFAWMIFRGTGVISYAWAVGISSLLISLGGIAVVLRGSHRFRITLKHASVEELVRMFRFSGAVFFVGLATQVYVASQGLVATKIQGLETAAIFAVTTRSVMLASQFVWRPLDAFSPRWQIAFCSGAKGSVSAEFALMTRLTLLLSVAGACAIALFNRPFVMLWTKPEYFGGMTLTMLAAVFIVIQSINRCYTAPFILTMKLRAYIWVSFGSIVLGVALMSLLTKSHGIVGIPAGMIATELVFPLWFYAAKGGGALLESPFSPLLADWFFWFPSLVLGFGAAWFLNADKTHEVVQSLWWSIPVFLVITTPMVFRCLQIFRSLSQVQQAQNKTASHSQSA
jgi:O-antigen/teichoic acid export membrane protein